MTSKFRTEFVTPWSYMKAREEMIPRIFSSAALEPFAEPGSMTYFDNRKNATETQSGALTGYDRLHDRSPYDQSKPRCDRTKRDIIWRGIHEENKRHSVAIIAEHWYGRTNRQQVDFPDGKFNRSNIVRSNFYRRNDVNLSMNEELPV